MMGAPTTVNDGFVFGPLPATVCTEPSELVVGNVLGIAWHEPKGMDAPDDIPIRDTTATDANGRMIGESPNRG